MDPPAGSGVPRNTTGSTGSDRSSTGSGWWWIGLAAVLVGLAAGMITLTRRRSAR